MNIRTDLAVESREMHLENNNVSSLEGTEIQEDGPVTRVKILTNKAATLLNKEIGNYITIDVPRDTFDTQEGYEELCKITATELKNLIHLNKEDTVLVVGLGNRNITPDSLGPQVTEGLLVSRHLIAYMPEEIDQRLVPLCAISPGVLGITGIETSEIIKGVTEKVRPSLIIAVDALCSRKMERINTTIQISDTGIIPGGGIGNKRNAINKETMGVPVISMGVPTVVDAGTIASDVIDLLLKGMSSQASPQLYKVLKTVEDFDKVSLISEVLTPGEFIVTPKEIDTDIKNISSVIANGINIAIHEGIGLDDIDRYI
ncbi:MAG: GPR endopeptidase [Clostridia bacterium]|nr:GPR endopeptidase [Clostridia bacterium]